MTTEPATHWLAVLKCIVEGLVDELLELSGENQYLDPGDPAQFDQVYRIGLPGLLNVFTGLEQSGLAAFDEGCGRWSLQHPDLDWLHWRDEANCFVLWHAGSESCAFRADASTYQVSWLLQTDHPRIKAAEAALGCQPMRYRREKRLLEQMKAVIAEATA